MENLDIIILNLTKCSFKNKETGEVKPMVRINYCYRVPDEDRFSGMAVLTCYQIDDYFLKLKDFVGRKVPATFRKVRLNNGYKLSLYSIDNKELKDL